MAPFCSITARLPLSSATFLAEVFLAVHMSDVTDKVHSIRKVHMTGYVRKIHADLRIDLLCSSLCHIP